MPLIDTMKNSKYLKKEDVGAGKLMTIERVIEQNVALEGQAEEWKWCVFFEKEEKPIVLNSTNAEAIADIAKDRNSDNWGGTQVVLYDDPNVSYAGKRIGGIRVRAPRGKAAAANSAPRQAVQAPEPEQEQPANEDDIPF